MTPEQPPSKKRKMSASAEVKTIYYYVSTNYPLVATSMDDESLIRAGKMFNVDTRGMFHLIGKRFENGVNHLFYLFKFKESKPASGAVRDDFVVDVLSVPTSTILCETQDRMPIDFDLTTVRSAKEALTKFAGEILDMVRKKTDHEIIEHRITSFIPAVLEHTDPPASIDPVPTMEAQAVILQIQPLPHRIPEEMYNEMLFSQIEKYAVNNGLAVVSNQSSVDGDVSHCSQFFRSRPDLIIYHPESDNQKAAYLLSTANEEQYMELDEEPDMTLKGGMTEHKLKVKDALGQLLGGMEKVSGDVAYRHLRKDLSVAKRSFQFIHVYGLLCDLETRKCRTYKLEMNFKLQQSKLFQGQEILEISEVVPRFLATLKN